MRNYFALPAPQVPSNAIIDMSGLSNAFETLRQQRNRNELLAREDEENKYQRGRQARSDSRADESHARGQVEWFGKQALAVDQLQGPERASAWSAIISKHPNRGRLTGDYLDPMRGPKMVAAEAGQWADKSDQGKLFEMDGRIVQVSPSGTTREVYTAPPKSDPLREMLMQRIQRPQGQAAPQAAPQQAAPQLMPQSNAAPSDPLLKLATDRAAPNPEMPAAPEATPDTIQTPYGAMSRQEAMDMAGAMLLDPKYAQAGKALMDSVNASGGEGLSRPAQSALDEKAIGMVDLAGRLDAIQGRFKPEYQTYDTGLKMYGLSWLDSIESLRGKIPPAERAKFEEYTAFRQDATNNLSEYIKYITGAAMGVQEEGRIRRGMPDPEKDSPSQFGAKLKNSIAQSKLALARYHYLRKNGYDDQTIQTLAKSDRLGTSLSLQQMQGKINERLEDAAKEIKSSNPNMDDNAIRIQLKKIQREEFGI